MSVQKNEDIIRELYALGEGSGKDTATFISLFSDEGYMYDVPSGVRLRGQEIGDSIDGLEKAFPDIHRELLRLYAVNDIVIVEIALRGTHRGTLKLASGTVAPTGSTIDVPGFDVFRLAQGKITSFHCSYAVSVMQKQLGLIGG